MTVRLTLSMSPKDGMNPTDPSVRPLEAPMPRDTQALVWVAALLFYATTWTAIAVYWLR